MMAKLLSESKISYIKWDMNRSMSEVFSKGRDAAFQGEVFHRHMLGIYSLYERLITEFPDILLNPVPAGGARFDPGMLYMRPRPGLPITPTRWSGLGFSTELLWYIP